MTNRDRLARMSNQELADEIKSWDSDICMCPAEGVCFKLGGADTCVNVILKWLEIEVDKQDA